MAPRSELQELLKQLLESENVYFQPPPTTKMLYPCIVYQRDGASTEFADNRTYSFEQRYQVTVIDRNPDSLIPGKLKDLPKTLYTRFFAANGLNHDVFTIFF